VLPTVLKVIRKMPSEPDRTQMLRELIERRPTALPAQFFQAIDELNDQGQTVALIESMIRNQADSEAGQSSLAYAMRLAEKLHDDGAKLNLLSLLQRSLDVSPKAWPVWKSAVQLAATINGQHDRVDAFVRLAEADRPPVQLTEWILLEASRMSSDPDRARLLEKLADRIPSAPDVREKFLKEVKRLPEEGQREVREALLRHSKPSGNWETLLRD
jgi:hypothetical protein